MSELVTLAEAVASLPRPAHEPAPPRHALPAVEPGRAAEPAPEEPVAAPAPPSRPLRRDPAEERTRELARAREDGYQAGMQDAIATEVEFLRLRAEDDHQHLRALMESIGGRIEALRQDLERDAYRFALAVAGRIVKAAVGEDREVVVRQVREAVRRVVGVESVILKVNPEDEAVVREQREKILSAGDSIRQLVIEADASIERGGCILETASGTVDARIATQLKQIDAVLFGAGTQGGAP